MATVRLDVLRPSRSPCAAGSTYTKSYRARGSPPPENGHLFDTCSSQYICRCPPSSAGVCDVRAGILSALFRCMFQKLHDVAVSDTFTRSASSFGPGKNRL